MAEDRSTADAGSTPGERAVLSLAHAYEAALAAGDAERALTFFDDEPQTTRFGPDGAQLDLDEVRELRRATAPTPDAHWVYERARTVAPDVVLHLALLERGGQTVQRTQLWVRRGDDWRIAHAHVSSPRPSSSARP